MTSLYVNKWILNIYLNYTYMNNNRRDFLKLTGLAGFGVAGSALAVQNLQASSQVSLSTAIDDSPSLTPLNRLPRMVQEYFVDHIR